jgi:hypothetical protein
LPVNTNKCQEISKLKNPLKGCSCQPNRRFPIRITGNFSRIALQLRQLAVAAGELAPE